MADQASAKDEASGMIWRSPHLRQFLAGVHIVIAGHYNIGFGISMFCLFMAYEVWLGRG